MARGREGTLLLRPHCGPDMERVRFTQWAGSHLKRPELLFERRFYSASHAPMNYHTYAVSADGQKVLAPRMPQTGDDSQFVTVVVNWPSLLKK